MAEVYRGPGVNLDGSTYVPPGQETANAQKDDNGIVANFVHGLKQGALPTIGRIATGSKLEEMQPDNLGEQISQGLGGAISMIPEFVASRGPGTYLGGAIGSLFGPVGTVIGAGIGGSISSFGGADALNAFLKRVEQEGMPDTVDEWIETGKDVGKAGLKGAGVGATFGTLGEVGSKVGAPLVKRTFQWVGKDGEIVDSATRQAVETTKYTAGQKGRKELAKLAGETVGMTEAGNRLEGRETTFEDYLVNAGVVGILHGANRLTAYAKYKVDEHMYKDLDILLDAYSKAKVEASPATAKEAENKIIEYLKTHNIPQEKKDAIRKGIDIWEKKDEENNRLDLSKVISEDEGKRASDSADVKEPIDGESPEVTRIIADSGKGKSRGQAALDAALIQSVQDGQAVGRVIKGAEVEAIEDPIFTEAKKRISDALGTNVRTFSHLWASLETKHEDIPAVLAEAVGALSKGEILVAPVEKRWDRVKLSALDVETLGHEGSHLYIALLGKNDPVVQKGLKLFNGSEEDLVENIGKFYRKEMEDRSLSAQLGRWLKELVARIKDKFGKADKDEIARILLSDMLKGKVKRESIQPEQKGDLFRKGEEDTTNIRNDILDRAEAAEDRAPIEAEKDRNFFERAADRFDVGAPFNRIGAVDTGTAMKGAASTVAYHIDKGIQLIKKVGKINSRPVDQAISLILAENPRLLKSLPKEQQARFKEMVDANREYLDSYKKELVDKDILKQGYIERKLIDLTVKTLNAKTDEARGKYLTDIDRLMEMNYVPVTYQIFFGQGGLKLGSLRKAYAILSRKQRRVFSLADLLQVKDEDGNRVVNLADFDYVDVIHHYAMKVGRDIAKQDVINAATKEGLVVDAGNKDVTGFMIPRGMSALQNKKVHPVLLEAITQMSTKDKARFIDAVITWGKMGAFINPIIMPMYDTLQGVMAGSINPLRPYRLFKLAYKSYRDMATFSDDYQNALRNYISSQPIEPPYLDTKRTMQRYRKGSMSGVAMSYLKELQSPGVLKLLGMTARQVYEASWALTWTLDKWIRMITYNHFIEKGVSPRDAAQTAAMFHGDYASVPRETRRALNKLFFTPTFKIVMGKLFWNMAKSFATTTGKIATGQFKKIGTVEGAYAWGMLRAGITLIALDTIMKRLGFDSDQFAQRFSRDYEDENGKRQELSIYLTNPINLPLKYSYRVWDAFTKNDGSNWMTHMLRSSRWELNPLWRVLWEVSENRGRDGAPVYQVGENRAIMALQGTHYAMTEIFRILQGLRLQEDIPTEQAKEQLDKEVGTMMSGLIRATGWASRRSPKYETYIHQLNSLKRAFLYEVGRERRSFTEKGRAIDEERMMERRNRILDQMKELMREVQEDKYLSDQQVGAY